MRELEEMTKFFSDHKSFDRLTKGADFKSLVKMFSTILKSALKLTRKFNAVVEEVSLSRGCGVEMLLVGRLKTVNL